MPRLLQGIKFSTTLRYRPYLSIGCRSVYALLACMLISTAIRAADKSHRLGGPCTYDAYPGKAKITRIEKTEVSRAQKQQGAPYEGYEIWFAFTPDKPIPHAHANERLKHEQSFQLMNSWYAGERYIQKYGIKTGKVYEATISIIKKGTCTPIIVELKGLDRIDYFESQSSKQ